MPSESNNFGRNQRGHEAAPPAPDQPMDASISSVALDCGTLFPRQVPSLSFHGEKGAVDKTFRALLSEANRELTSLLRDFLGASDAATAGAPQSQSVSNLLMRAVRCAMKQYMLQAELGSLALTDPLTGLYNRRGFLALAEQQLKLSRRSRRGVLLFFIDLDELKRINDSFGHCEGDLALIRTAEVLQKTFRDSDLLARFGGDEFAVLAIEASGHGESTITARLREHLQKANSGDLRYALSLSFGVARFDPRSTTSVGQLMVQADQAMFKHKRRRARSWGPVAHSAAS